MKGRLHGFIFVADQIATPTSPAAPVVSTTPDAPVVSTAPVTAPATVQSTPAPSSVSESVAGAVPTTPIEVAPVSAPVIPLEVGKLDTTPKKTALGETPVADAAKVDAPAEVKAESATVEVPLPTYEPWTMPEGVTADQLDKNGLDMFNKELGQFEALSKADHAETQKFAQGLVNLHINALKETVQNVNKAWQNQLDARQQGWAKAAAEHPVYGGNRFETSKAAANEFIGTHVGNAKEQASFRAMLDETGAGDHPEMLGLLARLNESYKEGRMIPATKAAPQAKLKPHQKAYGSKS